ncbi:MAG: LysM peptidoglycan-binding domain-containing protein [Gemmatimonadota bacterium]|nr:LysM peptidoglycan-binding domain-containing protein [Gemmatimonadota bacterium]
MRRRRLWLAALAVVAAACSSGRGVAARPGGKPSVPAPATSPVPPLATPVAESATPTDTVAPRELAEELVRIFGDSILVDSAAAPGELSWDIDVRSYETHARVEFFIGRFMGPARHRLAVELGRGGRYDAMIRAKLRAAKLPEDLTYLALIESGYDSHAYSRAAAVGIWQFMTATAKGVGLRVDWWVDERRDPVRSTDGAVKFLGWLKEQFGSLYLAAAAYNGGPGRISRGLSRYADALDGTTGDDTFFALAEQDYLRAETKDYVPKLIAAALVAKAPERRGLSVTYLPPIVFDTVRVGPATPLAAIAKAAGAELPEVMELNSHLLRGVTPLRDSFTVRVPVGKAAGFREAYLALPAAERNAFDRATTKTGDTRTSLARRGKISVKQLEWFNPGLRATKSGRLISGQTVLLPAPGVLAAALDVPDPAIERYGTSPSRAGAAATHVVRRGESLGSIAKKYRTTVATLKRLNRLKKTVIYPGQVIVVRAGTSSATRARPAAANGTTASGRTHLVRRGESLSSIARRYGTSVAALKELNGMKGDGIKAGQRIRVTR